MKTLEQQAAAAAKEHVALMAILAAEAVGPLSFPSEERAAVVAAAIPIVDREFRRNLAELEKDAEIRKLVERPATGPTMLSLFATSTSAAGK